MWLLVLYPTERLEEAVICYRLCSVAAASASASAATATATDDW